jgi:hypothetical protein
MQNIATVVIVGLCFPTFAFGQVNRPATPVVIAGSEVTHVGRTPAEHVTLGLAGGTNDTCPTDGPGWTGFVRRAQDGSPGGDFFVVPTGRALLLTDFTFYAGKSTSATWAPGDMLTVQMRRQGTLSTAWQTSKTLDASTAAATRAILKDQVFSGVVFSGGQIPCAKIGFGTEANDPGAFGITLSIVHGYLVDQP